MNFTALLKKLNVKQQGTEIIWCYINLMNDCTAPKINSYKSLSIFLKNTFDKEKSKNVVLTSPIIIASYHEKSMYVAKTRMQYGK